MGRRWLAVPATIIAVMAMDCPELKKPKGIHFERFRVIGGKELAAKVPGWAFGRSCAKMLNAFLKEKG